MLTIAICKSIALSLIISFSANHSMTNTPQDLIRASLGNRPDIVAELIQDNINVNYKNGEGKTALYYACWKGYTPIVRMLIDAGADIDVCNNKGYSAFYYACRNGHLNVAKLLVEKGVQVDFWNNGNETALYTACYKGHVDIVKLLIKHGAYVNVVCLKSKWTPLLVAARNGREDIGALLLKYGAKVNVKNTYGTTPLYFSCYYNHPKLAEALLEKDADVNVVCTKDQWPVLLAAVRGGDIDVVRKLLQKKADFNKTSKTKMDPLYKAVLDNKPEIVKLLLESGAKPEKNIYKGIWSPLKCAAKRDYSDIVAILLKYGADPLHKYKGKDALDVAKENSKSCRLIDKFLSDKEKKEIF